MQLYNTGSTATTKYKYMEQRKSNQLPCSQFQILTQLSIIILGYQIVEVFLLLSICYVIGMWIEGNIKQLGGVREHDGWHLMCGERDRKLFLYIREERSTRGMQELGNGGKAMALVRLISS
ncbi:hypothetical protein Fmac_016281 [Flemingia macrophylla]|uniref:Transmembrane protein n=1 Tax=Flemingia macrophylla TaxID=520843 RepID=A0ABD1MGX9_9FABA